MNTVLSIMFGICFAVIIFGLFILYRNRVVCEWRIKAINENFEAFLKGPSYDYMLYTFWIWDPDWYFYPEKRN